MPMEPPVTTATFSLSRILPSDNRIARRLKEVHVVAVRLDFVVLHRNPSEAPGQLTPLLRDEEPAKIMIVPAGIVHAIMATARLLAQQAARQVHLGHLCHGPYFVGFHQV